MTKAIGLFNMFLCYGATIMCVCTTVHMIAFASEYVQAFFMALAGGAMFFIARYLHWEWRQGKL
jgi:hypothetical protein